MKRKITIEEQDDSLGGAGGAPQKRVAQMGQGGDTQLAHVNPWEQALLQRLGGAGTRNPRTGLKQFYINPATGLEEDFFNMPLDIMPTSGSTNVSGGTSTALDVSGSQSQGQSASQSAQQAANYSGLPQGYQESLLNAIIPQLRTATADMGANYDKYTNEALGSYQQMMNNALRQNIPVALRNLANRGILSSTEGEGIMANVTGQAAIDAANKGYTTAMQAALAKANMPTILAQIADLGKSSYGTSSGTTSATSFDTSSASKYGTSSGSTYGSGSSYSQDPTKMYTVMADLIKSMM